MTGAGEPESVTAIFLSSSMFRVLGVEPLVEHLHRRGGRRKIAWSSRHDFWQRRFGGDRGIVGKSITLADTPNIVIGVMPPDFRFPEGNPSDMYSPLIIAANELEGRRAFAHRGRPAERRVTTEAATANMTAIAQGIAAADNTSNPDASVVGAHELLVQDVRLGLLVLLGTVAFVLLIACANVANLLLVRASGAVARWRCDRHWALGAAV